MSLRKDLVEHKSVFHSGTQQWQTA